MSTSRRIDQTPPCERLAPRLEGSDLTTALGRLRHKGPQSPYRASYVFKAISIYLWHQVPPPLLGSAPFLHVSALSCLSLY